jgi:hypothetical protein
MTKASKPFSTYPEDRARLLRLCAQVEKATAIDDAAEAGAELANLVRAILEDEQHAIDAGPGEDAQP